MIDLKDCHQNSLLCKFKTIYVSSQILIKKKLFLSRGHPRFSTQDVSRTF